MSIVDDDPSDDAAAMVAPEGLALAQNQPLVQHVRAILKRGDTAAFAALLQNFSELLEEFGPLGYLRFEPQAFAAHVGPELHAAAIAAQAAPSSDGVAAELPELLCEQLQRRVLPALCDAAFVQHLRHELQAFLSQSFVPRGDRLAACAALLTLMPQACGSREAVLENPGLYAIFRVQLSAWLQQVGVLQKDLVRAAGDLDGPTKD